MSDDIGYGKPPQHTRFKKGTSGNPKGRRRRERKNWDPIMEAVLDQKVQALINGKQTTITLWEAICRQIANKATKGSLSAFKAIIAIQQQADKSKADETAPITVVIRKFSSDEEDDENGA